MDHSAYHLQAHAHHAVANAIATGVLKRAPCEVCGTQPAQAHHDSYYPAKWLKVRWLCGPCHSSWHHHHEPEWPTVFEHHPTDEEWIRFKNGKPGRPPRPWFWRHRLQWAVTIDGRRYRLGRNKEDAREAFRDLLLKLRPGSVADSFPDSFPE